MKELKSNENPFVIVLVANKIDKLEKNKIQDLIVDGQKYAYEANLEFFACSALTGENINEIFDCIVKKLPLDLDPSKNGEDWKEAKSIKPVNLDKENQSGDSNDRCFCQVIWKKEKKQKIKKNK